MTFQHISLLQNIGQFDSVSGGAQIPLSKLSLIYAENGRGKTTLAAVLRSIGTGEPQLIEERRRLGAQHPPKVILKVDGAALIFQQGAWSASLPQVVVFDDAFVAANVCSGIQIETAHRQNLHELILGVQGHALNTALQGHIEKVEVHNRDLRTKQDAIPAAIRGTLTVDAFCATPADPDIETKITDAERTLLAARSADAIRQQANFATLSLPAFDIAAINALLARSLPMLEAEAVARVRRHLSSLGKGGEAWVGDGMARVADASEGAGHEVCPFCAQNLAGSALIEHYQAYFSVNYEALKTAINDTGIGVNRTHAGDVPAAFERSVRIAMQSHEFWRAFIDVPDIDLDTAAIVRAWNAAREDVLSALRAKAASPLDEGRLSPKALAAIATYDVCRARVVNLSSALEARNAAIAIVKEKSADANVITLIADLAKLNLVKVRHQPSSITVCDEYLMEKAAKAVTEKLRNQARTALDHYREQVFSAYEQAINVYLQRFNAGFRLGSVTSVNNRAGSSANYNVLINNTPVTLTAESGPCFRNTLSAGDRNTLALSFFFASLDRDPQLAQKLVVIDDPMTSLDEHRSLTTVQEIHELTVRVGQMIVLSHSKPFLCAIWEGADKVTRSALRITRDGPGSTLAAWDVRQDCITEHDRRHKLVTEYLGAGNPATERAAAAALRPILEAFARVAYPEAFPPGTLLGPFYGNCQSKIGTSGQILNARDATELRALLDYSNKFHHDTNAAWETQAINDQELTHFCRRTLAFAKRS